MTACNKKPIVLFCPMNSFGHLNGCYGLAEQLTNEGCECVFFTIDEPATKPKGVNNQFKTIVVKDERIVEQTVIDDETKVEKKIQIPISEVRDLKIKDMVKLFSTNSRLHNSIFVMKFINEHSIDFAKQFNQDYQRAIDELKPSLIIIDMFYPPPALTSSNIPWIIFLSANPLSVVESKISETPLPLAFIGYSLKNKQERQQLREQQPDEWKKIVDSWIKDKELFKKEIDYDNFAWNKFALENNGQQTKLGKIIVPSPFLNIYMYPWALDYNQDDDLFEYPANYFNCETTLNKHSADLKPEIEKEWLDKIANLRAKPGNENKPLIYFSLGSLASMADGVMSTFVDFLKDDTERLYIFSKGKNGDKYQLNNDNMIGDNFVPQLFILKHVDMAVVHGGNNSITECVYYGVPCIAIPVFGDQPDNAQRLEDLKLGHSISLSNINRDELIGKIDSILKDTNLRKKIKQFGEEMRKRNEVVKCAEKVMKIIRSKE